MNNIHEDYQRLVHDSGYVPLRGWTCLRVTGADRAAFLHNLCTNNVTRLQPGQGCEAFFTDVKGHVLGHAMLLCRPDSILLWTVPGQAADLVRHLDKYLIREDVHMEDASADAELIVLAGEARWRALGSDCAPQLATTLTSVEVGVNALRLVLVTCDWFGPEAVLIQVAADAAASLRALLDGRGAAACDPAALEVLRVEQGTPYYAVDFDQGNLPQEVNRNERTISFTKGCYLGQETVARIDALGHVNKLLVGVQMDAVEPPPRSATIRGDGREVGQVTSCVWSERLGRPLGLAMVRRGFHEPGTPLTCQEQPSRIVKLPLG